MKRDFASLGDEAKRLVDELVRKREALLENRPSCPFCGEDSRIVLASYQINPPVWRCDNCTSQFSQ